MITIKSKQIANDTFETQIKMENSSVLEVGTIVFKLLTFLKSKGLSDDDMVELFEIIKKSEVEGDE